MSLSPEPSSRIMKIRWKDPPGGEVAQLGERGTRIAEVGGSNPLFSTIFYLTRISQVAPVLLLRR